MAFIIIVISLSRFLEIKYIDTFFINIRSFISQRKMAARLKLGD